MDLVGINYILTKNLFQYADTIRKGGNKSGKEFVPDMAIFDLLNMDETKCLAYRTVFTGTAYSNAGLKKYLKTFPKNVLQGVNNTKMDDVDGDGKKETVAEYILESGGSVFTRRPDGKLCNKNSWPRETYTSKTFIYVIKFSTGANIVVNSLSFFIDAGKE